MMIYPVTGWFEIAQQNDKIAISIAKLVETKWLSIYLIPTEIKYDQGSELIGHDFRKSITEMEYRIVDKPSTSENPMSNAILEQIHQVLGKLVWTCIIIQTYVDKYEPWLGILDAGVLEIHSTTNILKVYSAGQLVFGCNMILLIKH